MEPHVKIIKLANTKTHKGKLAFIRKHKADVLFIKLLLLSVSPDFKYKPFDLPTDIRPVPTLKTKDRINRFQTLVYLVSSDDVHREKLIEFLNALDSPMTVGFSYVVNRQLGVTIGDLYSLKVVPNRYNRNQTYQTYGYPTFPCYLQDIDVKAPRVNIHNSDGIIITTFSGEMVFDVDEEMLDELSRLSLTAHEWVTGYIVNGAVVLTELYTDQSLPLKERMVDLSRRIELSNTFFIKMTPTYYIKDEEDLTSKVVVCVNTPVSKNNTVPDFTNKLFNQIDLSYVKETYEVHGK